MANSNKITENVLNDLKELNQTLHDRHIQRSLLPLRKKDVAQDIKLKKQIVWWVMGVVSIYLMVITGITGSTGWQGRLEPIVLVTLLTTTTINILGLPLMIIHLLFPKRKNSDKSFHSANLP